MSPTTATQDLGRQAELDPGQLETGEILWQRFCVVGQAREQGGITILLVADLERTLGDAPAHHLEIHLLPTPSKPEGRQRLQRAFEIVGRTQPRVFATLETGTKLAVICEPVIGQPVAARQATPEQLTRQRLVIAYELAELLTKLHAAGVQQVRFEQDQLRSEEGHFVVDGFSHLLGTHQDSRSDVIALLELLGESEGELASPQPQSARELLDRVRALANLETDIEQAQLPSEPPFIGRENVLSQLSSGFARAQIAQPTAIVLDGARGVGKSRLLREFVTARLEAGDAFVLTGTWQPRSADVRGGLLGALEQLARILRTLDIEERGEVRRRINNATRNLGAILARSAPALGSVLREVEELPQLELSGDFSRHTAVIADVLRSIGTARRPLVLVLDNLENADSGSLGVLKVLTQTRPAHHTLVLGGHRVGDGPATPLFESDKISLLPFSLMDVERLLEHSLPGEIDELPMLAQQLHTTSGGVPLTTWATLRTWLDQGRILRDLDAGRWRPRKSFREGLDRPSDVQELFRERLGGATKQASDLALSMAIIGSELEHADLTEISLLEPEALDAALTNLAEHGILIPTKTGYRFPHDSIRELVLESVEASKQREIHARAAVLMHKRKAPLAQVVYHRELALDAEAMTHEGFDELSRLHAEAGRERLAVYDLERARWHLERALEHSRDPDQRSVAAEGLADVCLLSGDLDNAVSLYTAIIATAELDHALRSATKVAYFLLFKSELTDGQLLGNMALERVPEPTPSTPAGKIFSALRTLVTSWFREPPHDVGVREALTALYTPLIVIGLTADPFALVMHLIRARWICRGLKVGAVASVLSFEASVRASMGHYRAADELFTRAETIARDAQDAWAIGIVNHTWGHNSLLPSNRYEEGQDRLVDAIASFRETGDVSVATVSLLWKALYGRDREPTNITLGWIDEAISMARRNGKELMRTSLEAARLAVLARQGRTDLAEKIRTIAADVAKLGLSDLDRIVAYGQLAFAARDSGELKLALSLVTEGQRLTEKQPSLPDFCRDIHVATIFVIHDLHAPSRLERKLQRRSLRALEKAAKVAPRLTVMLDLFELRVALAANNTRRLRTAAVRLVNNFETHGNLHAARQAHRALAQTLRGDDVLAASKHERIALTLGRQLGIDERMLSDELSDMLDGQLLDAASPPILEESRSEVPAAGMLTASVTRPVEKADHDEDDADDSQSEILAAWALGDSETERIELQEMLTPVRDTVAASVPTAKLQINTKHPRVRVAIASSDLQVLLITLMLTSRDAIGNDCEMVLDVNVEKPDGTSFDQASSDPTFLAIRLQTRGHTSSTPVLGGFATCEALVRRLGGKLSASTDRSVVVLEARLPLETRARTVDARSASTVLIVHPEHEVRESITAALSQLGVIALALEPESFEIAQLETVSMLLADSDTLMGLSALEPLLNAQLVEILRRDAESTISSRPTLRLPIELADLEAIL